MKKRTYADPSHQDLLSELRAAGPDGITVAQLRKRLGADPDKDTELHRKLRSLARDGTAVRVSRSRFSAGVEDTEEIVGPLKYERGRYVVASTDIMATIPENALGDAIAGDIVAVAVGVADEHGHGAGEVIRVEKAAPREFYVEFERNGRALVAGPAEIDEPVVFFDDETPEGKVAVRVSGRADTPTGVSHGVPKRPLLVVRASKHVARQMERDFDPEQEEPPRRLTTGQAFEHVRKGTTNATELLDQLARSMAVDIPFSQEAIEEAGSFDAPDEVPEDLTDLTDEPLCTIDGEDAKDFDDAVMARRIGKDIEILVAIADVSAYVERGGQLDIEARERGSSVYLPGRVYPMLPEHLSNGVCSLVPNELRRCAWVRMRIGPRAGLKAYDLGFGIIRSHARLTYASVQEFLDGDEEAIPEVVRDSVATLEDAYRRLSKKRRRRGMMDLDLGESKIVLSEDGDGVERVQPAPRWISNRLIEECMLLTNETVADYLASQNLPCIYRSHAEPDDDRLEQAFRVVAELTGQEEPEGNNRTIDRVAEALDELRDHPMGRIASIAILRAMTRAEYSVTTDGHFGIGARRYAHFTSPIRRYADLEVHRVLRAALEAPGLMTADSWVRQLKQGARAANEGGQRADMAERFAGRLLRARYMLDRVGESYEGRVTSILHFGVFVTLDESNVEGMVHISKIGSDHFEYDEDLQRLKGRRSGKLVRLGDRVRIRVNRVEVHEGKVDFHVEEWLEDGSPDELAGNGGRNRKSSNRRRSGGRNGSNGSQRGQGKKRRR